MDRVHRGGPWSGSMEVVHGLGPQGWSMDWVHRGGPWSGFMEVVHGLGPQGWSMEWVHGGDPWTGSMEWVHGGGPLTGSTWVVHGPRPIFCIRPLQRALSMTISMLFSSNIIFISFFFTKNELKCQSFISNSPAGVRNCRIGKEFW